MTVSDEMRNLNKCKSILIVEDEPSIRENLKFLLELEGYPVFTAVDGKEGLQVLRKMPRPCLVLLDLLMPVMNGMEFLEAKSHEDAIASIPVCVVSGVSEDPKLAQVSAFVKKPIHFEGLLKFVKHYCGSIPSST
ncbi:MAG: response regulator [Bdellovibrionia bacterium]